MNDWLQIFVAVVALLVAGCAVYVSKQKGETLTLGATVEHIKDAVPVAVEIAKVAEIGVRAAEQLKNTGKLPDNDAAFEYALDYVRRNVPYISEVSNQDIKTAIESAVLLVNNITKVSSSQE